MMTNVQAMLSGEAGDGKEEFELPVLVKADVQGSEQALMTALRWPILSRGVCTLASWAGKLVSRPR